MVISSSVEKSKHQISLSQQEVNLFRFLDELEMTN